VDIELTLERRDRVESLIFTYLRMVNAGYVGRNQEEVRRHIEELAEKGIYVRAASPKVLAEEMPEAYKDVADVVAVVERAGLARRVCRMRPLGVVKG